DFHVTGVQTCALPIFRVRIRRLVEYVFPLVNRQRRKHRVDVPARQTRRSIQSANLAEIVDGAVDNLETELLVLHFPPAEGQRERSEERRVEKECRSRW